jgi:hypothetical protein
MAYDVDMKVELFKVGDDGEGEELLDTFEFDDLKKMYKQEVDYREKKADEKLKKKLADKKKNKTESNDTAPAEEEPEADTPITIEKPKLKFAIELTRSGLLKVSRVNIGSSYVNYKKAPKAIVMNADQKK